MYIGKSSGGRMYVYVGKTYLKVENYTICPIYIYRGTVYTYTNMPEASVYTIYGWIHKEECLVWWNEGCCVHMFVEYTCG